MRMKKTIHIVLALLTAVSLLTATAARADSMEASEKPATEIATETSKRPICSEIHKLLSLPENSTYLALGRPTDYPDTLFFIPASDKRFSVPEWEVSSEETFSQFLPRQYTLLKNYLARESEKPPQSRPVLKSIKSTKIDAFNNGSEYLLFRVDIGVLDRNYIYEPDSVYVKRKQIFDDDGSGTPIK